MEQKLNWTESLESRRGLRQRRLLESIPFDKPAKKPLIKCGHSRSPH